MLNVYYSRSAFVDNGLNERIIERLFKSLSIPREEINLTSHFYGDDYLLVSRQKLLIADLVIVATKEVGETPAIAKGCYEELVLANNKGIPIIAISRNKVEDVDCETDHIYVQNLKFNSDVHNDMDHEQWTVGYGYLCLFNYHKDYDFLKSHDLNTATNFAAKIRDCDQVQALFKIILPLYEFDSKSIKSVEDDQSRDTCEIVYPYDFKPSSERILNIERENPSRIILMKMHR